MKVEYLDHMGSDVSIADIARVSFDRHEGKDRDITDKDISLLKMLGTGYTTKEREELLNATVDSDFIQSVRSKASHWTPFSHCMIQTRCTAPIPIRTQAFKSKIGFTENEQSRRYISSEPEIFMPEYFRERPDGSIKQGSGDKHVGSAEYIRLYKKNCNRTIALYNEMIANGICPEQARFVLPQGVKVTWIWTGSLAAYARFYNLRSDPHAQKEIQDFAAMHCEIAEKLFPHAWKALTTF